MTPALLRFWGLLALYSLIVFLIMELFERFLFPVQWVYSQRFLIQAFMMLVTALIHFGLMRAAARSGGAFIRFAMGASAAKLFIFVFIMVIFGILDRSNAVSFILNFFVLYLFYTVFEVGMIYHRLTKAGTDRAESNR